MGRIIDKKSFHAQSTDMNDIHNTCPEVVTEGTILTGAATGGLIGAGSGTRCYRS